MDKTKELEIVKNHLKTRQLRPLCYDFITYDTEEECKWLQDIKHKYNMPYLIIEPNLVTIENTLAFIEMYRNRAKNSEIITKTNKQFTLYSQISRSLGLKHTFYRQNIMFDGNTFYIYEYDYVPFCSNYHHYATSIKLTDVTNELLLAGLRKASSESMMFTSLEMNCLAQFIDGGDVFVVDKKNVGKLQTKMEMFGIPKTFIAPQINKCFSLW